MLRRPHRRGLADRLVSAGAALVLAATGLAATGTGAQAAQTGTGTGATSGDKIRPELTRQLQGKSEGDFWIHFRDRADLAKAAADKDWVKRGAAVADALKKTAAESQARIRAELDSSGTKYQTFWATNAIKVSGGSLTMAQNFAAHAEVDGLYAPTEYKLPEVTEGTDEKSVNALEWGIANINADDVWSQYGVKGAGITVASIDSGVQFDHPALVNSYRGNNGDGTFDHDYNWFDAAGDCATAPCDSDGHGTHTMGTMAGSDGANQIGVAPGVRWIAANGCCPTDAALISSGQWMLEPTDLNGQNPDASKRPNIINNSWGTTLPSTEPFMEDVTDAWTASGIFGTWSNGNNGPSCQTSGSPGSLSSNYSAGAYDVNNNIASFSSRGTGQNGEIKPNLSAPGVNVRSSVPGNSYASYSGTSMAAPHLAGAVALLWSAAPTLVGDVAATRALLDNTAVDKADTQCGGSTDDNSVYGEGRLDALALLNAAPIGDNGTLAGKVTDAGTGAPIAGATVALTGAATRSLTTGADGTYSSLLLAGDYQVAVSAFGYQSRTLSATVTSNATTTLDVALTAVPSVTVGGQVTDGSGHGWPLYAKVSVDGLPVSDHTTPANGRYSLKLPAGATYRLKVESRYPGYQSVTKEVVVGSGNVTSNIAVPADPAACTTAPGYTNSSDGEYETFDGDTVPEGWSVVDNAGTGQVWKFTDSGERGNLTGGAGRFAIIDSDDYGSGGRQDTSLVSPVVDLTDVATPVIRFNQDYNWLNSDRADVDLSLDGGTTWSNVLRQAADVRGPRVTEVPIPQAAGQAQVRVRFHYYDASWEWWWQVDNVLIGSRIICKPLDGGLVLGHVRDRNDNGYVNGATVTSDDRPAEKATTVATPDDTELADGFYWMFSSLTGAHPFTARAGNYVSQTKQVDVETDWATAANFQLAAGRLAVQPASVTGTVRMPTGKVNKTFTVTNTGGAPVTVEFTERDGGFVLQRADGSRLSEQELLGSTGAPAQRLTAPTSFAARPSGKSATAAVATPAGPQAAPWTGIANYPANVMDNRVVNLDGKVYSIAGGDGTASSAKNYAYDPIAQSWTAVADLPGARNAMTVGVVDGRIIATGGWGASGPDGTTWSYDPAANTWTRKADNPAPRAAAGQAVADGKLYAVGGCTTASCLPMSNSVVRYDPGADTWETLPNYPKSVAFLSCGGIGGTVYCTGGNDGTTSQKASYAFDPGANAWTAVADAPADNWASSFAVANGKLLVVGGSQGGAITNAGFAYDPATDSWANLPNANAPRYRGGAACGFYKVGGSSGGFTATKDSEVLPGFEECAEGPADVSWLTVDKSKVTLAPGEKVTVTVGMTANVDQPGTYSASVAIKENTPYTVAPVAVSMVAQPPTTWGKLMGTVSGTSCQGATAPLPGAVVQVDSWAMSWTFATDADGRYAYWMDRRNNPLTIIVAKDGWKPQTRQARISTATPTVEDFTLSPIRC